MSNSEKPSFLSRLSFTEKTNFKISWQQKFEEIKLIAQNFKKESKSDVQIVNEVPFLNHAEHWHELFLILNQNATNPLQLNLIWAKAHFKTQAIVQSNNNEISEFDFLASYDQTAGQGSPQIIQEIATKKQLLVEFQSQLSICSWQYEKLQIQIEVQNEDGWKIWASILCGSEQLNIWDVRFIESTRLIFYNSNIYEAANSELIPFLKYLRETGPILVDKNELGQFLQSFINLFGQMPLTATKCFEVQEILLKPDLLLYLKANSFLPIVGVVEAQLWFRYLKSEYPAKCHAPHLQSIVIATNQHWHSETNTCIIELQKRDFNLEAAVNLDFQSRSSAEWSHGKLSFKISNIILAGLIEYYLEHQWEIWAENLRVKLLKQIQLHIKSHGFGFSFDIETATTASTLQSWQWIHILKRKSAFIKLDDGSLGILPQAWLKELWALYQKYQIKDETGVFPNSAAFDFMNFEANGLSVSGDEFYKGIRDKLSQLQQGEMPVAIDASPNFGGTLYDYQKHGLGWLSFLNEFGFGGLLADEMGLGKTVQIIAFLDRDNWLQVQNKTLIVVPKSILKQWQNDFYKFAPKLKCVILDSRTLNNFDREGSKSMATFDVALISYGLLRRRSLTLNKIKFDRVILDEAQIIKNENTLIYKAISSLTVSRRIAITGTPIENHLSEFLAIFGFLNPGLVNEPIWQGEVLPSEQFILNSLQRLRPLVMKRRKSDVLKDLPEKYEETIVLSLKPEQIAIYKELQQFYANKIKEFESEVNQFNSYRAFFLEGILRLRQVCCHPELIYQKGEVNQILSSVKFDYLFEQLTKIVSPRNTINAVNACVPSNDFEIYGDRTANQCEELFEKALEEPSQEPLKEPKVVIFSQFTKFLKIIADEMNLRQWRFAYLDGQTQNRQEVIDQFQNDDSIPFFLISLKAGGLGLNLTAASVCIILDPWWNSAVENQAIDRIYRVGQTRPVLVKRILTLNTIEQKIVELHKNKQKHADYLSISEANFLDSLSLSDLQGIFNCGGK